MTNMMFRLNEYCPLEVRRCLATKDYRYIANWDYRVPGAVLFDQETGKSLS